MAQVHIPSPSGSKPLANVSMRASTLKKLEEFVSYFIKEFEIKLISYQMILEGESKKTGKISDTFSEIIGTGIGGGLGLVAGLGLQFLVPVIPGLAAVGTKAGMAAGGRLGTELGNLVGQNYHEEKVMTFIDLLDQFQNDRASFREILAIVGFDVFQSFEMQFMGITSAKGHKYALHQLAKDAVNRLFCQWVKEENISMSEHIILGDSKREKVYSLTSGYEIKYETQTCKRIWNSGDLFSKTGIVNNSKYYKVKTGTCKTSKFGYRRLLLNEQWDQVKENYTDDNTYENQSIPFTDYDYILDPTEWRKYTNEILRKVNSEDESLKPDRILEILNEVKEHCIQMTEILAEKQKGDKYLLKDIRRQFDKLDLKQYLPLIEQILQDIAISRKEVMTSLQNATGHREKLYAYSQKEHEMTREFVQNCTIDLSHRIEKGQANIIEEIQTKKTITKEPVLFRVNPPTDLFIGRSDALADLYTSLSSGSQMTAVSGLGGIGKTELVKQFLKTYAENYENFIWILAENENSLEESFMTLATDKLNIRTKNADGNQKEFGSVLAEIYKYFEGGKTIIVFDNAERVDWFRKVLPPKVLSLDKTIHVIITSRDREWWQGTHLLDLMKYEFEGSIFVKKVLGLSVDDTSEDKAIDELVEKLQCFPLALLQAGCYIYDARVTDVEYKVKDYLNEYDKKTEKILQSEIFQDLRLDSDYKKSTFTTWQITMKKISEMQPFGPLSREIFNIIAYLAPHDIQRDFFIDLAKGDEENLKFAIRALVRFSMINCENGQKLLNVHRLVQQVTRLELKHENKADSILNNAAELLIRYWVPDKCFASHVEEIIAHLDECQLTHSDDRRQHLLFYVLRRLSNDYSLSNLIHGKELPARARELELCRLALLRSSS